jgi:hypothetical protein
MPNPLDYPIVVSPVGLNAEVKVLCAVVHGLYEPWISILKNGQIPTWLSDDFPKNFSVVHFHGRPVGGFGQEIDRMHEKMRWSGRVPNGILRVIDRILLFPFLTKIPKVSISTALPDHISGIQIEWPDIYATMRWKDLAIIEYFYTQTDSDFLFMTTSSSYIRPFKLIEYCSKFEVSDVYAGSKPYPDAEFISGANRLLSRSAAEAVLSSKIFWDPAVIEDVALGDLMRKNGIVYQGYDQINIPSLEYLESVSDEKLESGYHFRVKSGNIKERNDDQIMKRLSERFKQIESR